jgi:hypothetical protein
MVQRRSTEFESSRETSLDGARSRLSELTSKILARLDEVEQHEEELGDQKLVVAKAVAAYELALADVNIAQLAYREYAEGLLKQDQLAAESEKELADAESKIASNSWVIRAESEKKGPAVPADPSPLEELTIRRAKLAFEQARLKCELLTRLTRQKRLAELKKEIDRARAEAESRNASLALERLDKSKLERQQREGALSPLELQALALVDELPGPDTSVRSNRSGAHVIRSGAGAKGVQTGSLQSAVDQACRIWSQATRERAEQRDVVARARIRRAVRSGQGEAAPSR